MSFKNFGKRKKRKNPVVSHLACTTGFFRLLNFRMWFKYGLKAQKLLAQGSALGNYGRKPVAL